MQVLLGEPSFSSKAHIMNITATFRVWTRIMFRARAGMRAFFGDCLRGRD
jgi:hypothetical protein